VKLWFDEDLSPTLVPVANELGFEATCNRDRGMLGSKDRDLRLQVQVEGYVLVSDNASDFRPMYAREDIHPGLIVMPARDGRAKQQDLAREVLALIANAAADAAESTEDFMVDKLVEIDDQGQWQISELPPIEAGWRACAPCGARGRSAWQRVVW
jgi:predicted nuclease of predicted toxin-antitoxin system